MNMTAGTHGLSRALRSIGLALPLALLSAWGAFAADAALASEASGQRGNSSNVRAHSASEDARERAGETRPEPGSSARAVTIGDRTYVNQGLVGVGRLPADLRDKFGE